MHNKNIRALLFLLKFAVIFSLFILLIHSINTAMIEGFIATIIAKALGLEYYNNVIPIAMQNFVINKECSGLVAISIWLAVMLSIKIQTKARVISIVIGSAVIFLANIFRLLVVVGTATISKELAEIIHVVSWFLMLLVILAAWFYFMKKYKTDVEF